MEEFASGTDVTLSIEHTYNDNELTVTDLQFELIDSEGVVLLNYATPVGFDPDVNPTIINIDQVHNTSSEKIDVRQVNIKLITASGTYNRTIFYKLIGDLTKLTPMTDSFMTFPESVVVRARMSDSLEFYDELPDALKAIALENAYQNLLKLRFNTNTGLTGSCETGIAIDALNLAQFQATNPKFQAAIKKAQIMEANALVENSPIREKIRLGIISETIGESSMFFKQSGVGITKFKGISDEGYSYLSDFLFKSARHAQIWKLARA